MCNCTGTGTAPAAVVCKWIERLGPGLILFGAVLLTIHEIWKIPLSGLPQTSHMEKGCVGMGVLWTQCALCCLHHPGPSTQWGGKEKSIVVQLQPLWSRRCHCHPSGKPPRDQVLLYKSHAFPYLHPSVFIVYTQTCSNTTFFLHAFVLLIQDHICNCIRNCSNITRG